MTESEWLDKAMGLAEECETCWRLYCEAVCESDEEVAAEKLVNEAREALRAYLSLRAAGDVAEPVAWQIRIFYGGSNDAGWSAWCPLLPDEMAWSNNMAEREPEKYKIRPLYDRPPSLREALRLAKDAERYRFLRKGAELDASIDAAINAALGEAK